LSASDGHDGPIDPSQDGWRRFRAWLWFLRGPLVSFLPLLIMLVVVLAAGSICFHCFYDQRQLGYAEALFVTWSLVSNQASLEFPHHPVLELFFFILPPLGLVVILDGIVRFSYHVLRREETSPEWVRAMCKTMNNHVVLCGLGKLGLRTLQQLLAMGEQVAVLEKNPDCPNFAYARRNGVPVRVGHSREEGVFEDLNVAHAKSIILATNDDLANLEMALDARKIRPDIRVVIRMFDQELAEKLRDSMGMELTFSTSELAAPLFATCSSDHTVVNSFYVDDRLLTVARLTVNAGSELAGTAIRHLGQGHHVFVLSHVRKGEATFFPSGDTVLQAGDQITVQTESPTLKDVHRLNRDPEPY
jgi:voltage-gated potassium channel